MNWVIAKMDHLRKCAVGQQLNSKCHETTYTGKVGFLQYNQLGKEDNSLIQVYITKATVKLIRTIRMAYCYMFFLVKI